jgi:hypothetical protein
MSPPSTVSSILELVDIPSNNRKDAEALLNNFVTLKEEEKKNTRSVGIQSLFPLVFGENVLVETSLNSEELKKSPWYLRSAE